MQWLPMVPPTPVVVLASQGPMWQWLTVGAKIPGVVLPREISWMVKSKWLLGWQIYTWMPQPSCLHPVISYGLGNCLSTFLSCHGVNNKVGWFPTHVPSPVNRNAASPASSRVRPSPSECLQMKRIALLGPITTALMRPVLALCSISSTRGAIQA